MKRLIPIIISCCLIWFSCDDEKSTPSALLELEKTNYGGCFDETKSQKSNNEMPDTMYVEQFGDSLKLTIVMGYNCCGILNDVCAISNIDIVNIMIEDTCTGEYCECNCMCSFEFYYYLTGFEKRSVSFKVFLKGYMQEDYTAWKYLDYNL